MTDTITAAFIGLGGGISGVLLGCFVSFYFSKRIIRESHKNSIDIIKRQEFNKAAASFRSEFINELRELRSIVHFDGINYDFVYNLIKSAIIRHELAYIKFLVYIPDSEREGFDRAWRKYSNPSSIKKTGNPNPLSNYYADGKTIEEFFHLAISNIEGLLKYANPK